MRLILGIDESGYGPRVGPLAVAACLLRVPDAVPAVGDTLWRLLKDEVIKPVEPLERTEDPSPPQVFIGDSKLVHVIGWPHELERAALALIGWQTGAAVKEVGDVLQLVVGGIDGQPPWLSETLGTFPVSDAVILPAARIENEHIEVVDLSACVVSARQFNDACDQAGNKALVNWALVAMLIEKTLGAIDEPIEIVVDRQGGRAHYEPLLSELFGDNIELLDKTSKRSAYAVPDANISSIEFLVHGDVHCFAVAAASIIAKYMRELLMARLNDFFCSKLPNLERTEGYYSDGNRFVRETESLRSKLGIPDNMFVRKR